MHSSQGKTLKSAGWDFSIGGSSSTGTVRSAVKPQARERKAEVSLSRASSKRTLKSGNRRSSSGITTNKSDVSIRRDSGAQLIDEKQDSEENVYLTPSFPDVNVYVL